MTDSMRQLISDLRRQLPAPISMCRDAIVASGGDLDQARSIVVRELTNMLIDKAGMAGADAEAYLEAAGFDVERAVVLWYRDNPPPPPPARDRLARGVELAAEVHIPPPDMRRYAHVIPQAEDRYELRLITHHYRYTETQWGWDYDVAIKDPQTRLSRVFTQDIATTLEQLERWGVSEDMLQRPETFDSCLLNSPIDGYLFAGGLPHLGLDDA